MSDLERRSSGDEQCNPNDAAYSGKDPDQEEQFRFYGDPLFGAWRLNGRRISVRYLEAHEDEFDWRPHSHNPLMLMPWRDEHPLRYEESMGEA